MVRRAPAAGLIAMEIQGQTPHKLFRGVTVRHRLVMEAWSAATDRSGIGKIRYNTLVGQHNHLGTLHVVRKGKCYEGKITG